MLVHSAIVFGGLVVANVFGYLFYVLVARMTIVSVYGEVFALGSALLVVGAPATVGQLIVARIAAGLEEDGARASLRRLGDLATLWSAAAGALVIVLAILARTQIAEFFNLAETAPVIAGAIATAALLVAYVQRGVLQGAHLFGSFATSLVCEAVVKVALIPILIPRFGVTGAMASVAAGLGVAAVFNVVSFHRKFGRGRARLALDRRTLVRIVTGVGLGQLTITVLSFYDVPLVKHAFDPQDAGLYGAAALIGRLVIGACAFVPTIVLPKANARVAAGRSPLPLLFAAIGMAAAIVAAVLLACAFVPGLVITVLAGHRFAAAAPLLLPYAFAFGALALATVVASYNFGLHRYAFVAPAAVVACAEIATLAMWHPSLTAVVGVLAAGHACLFAATLYRITDRVSRRAAARLEPEPIPAGEPIA